MLGGMASKFHALFGVCRNKGGTKAVCYKKAVKALGGTPKRKKAKAKAKRRRCAFGRNKITGGCLLRPRRKPAKKKKDCCAACA